jgi:antitoxin ParD1/3/4
MKSRYVLAPQAARDLVEIWRYIKRQSTLEMADHVESVIRDRFAFLAEKPSAGHWRKDLTADPVRFLAVYRYLIVYRPQTRPLQIVAVLHGRRDVERLLTQRGP